MLVQAVAQDKVVCHAQPVRLHGVVGPVVHLPKLACRCTLGRSSDNMQGTTPMDPVAESALRFAAVGQMRHNEHKLYGEELLTVVKVRNFLLTVLHVLQDVSKATFTRRIKLSTSHGPKLC